MIKFVCQDCNYKFEAKENPKTCPYCGKNSVEGEKTASDLLTEVSKTLEEN